MKSFAVRILNLDIEYNPIYMTKIYIGLTVKFLTKLLTSDQNMLFGTKGNKIIVYD